MKHIGPETESLLGRLLDEAGVAISEKARQTLLAYLDGLIETNQTLNLTRIVDPTEGVRLHLVDALVALQEVAAAPAGPLLDIGTGGGIPGVPLCVAGERQGTLLDSVAKKAAAVNSILQQNGLSERIVAIADRAEHFAHEAGAIHAVITARAVAELPALVELASPLLISGGLFVALKGSPTDDELDRGAAAAEICGMRTNSVRRLTLPEGGEARMIVTYERVGDSRVRLPRRIGLAQKSPLA